MAEQMKIQGPVVVQSDGSTRVAFELMEKIAYYDQKVPSEKRDATYWLTLYSACSKATHGQTLDLVLGTLPK